MTAPERLVEWLAQYEFRDAKGLLPPGLKLQYHSRSDEYSKQLGEFIVEDLLDTCTVLREQAARGEVAYGINYRYRWPSGKVKTLDLAFGLLSPPISPAGGTRIQRASGRGSALAFTRLLIAIEEKANMTEHTKSQPRIYSELNDAHTIVHQGSRDTVAGGITMVNIAATFVSPLRQRPDRPVNITLHRQPGVVGNMVEHLRRLPLRGGIDDVGLEAYCTFVVDLDNQGHVALHTAPPAPQPSDADHYDTFLGRLCQIYTERFADLSKLAPPGGLSIEDALIQLAKEHPGMLSRVADLAIASGIQGATELQALFQAIQKR